MNSHSMRICFTVMLQGCLWSINSPNVNAQADADIQKLVQMMQEVNGHILSNQLTNAEPTAKRLVEFSESTFRNDPAVRIMAAALAASVFDLQGKYIEEEQYLSRTLFLLPYLDTKSDSAIHTLKSLQMAALAYQGQKRYVESEKLYRKALAISEANQGTPTEVINNLIFLGIAAQAQAHYPEAQIYFRRAMSVGESAGLTENDYYVMALLALGTSLQSQGRLAEALPLAQRGLKICEENPDASLHLSDALGNLASIYEKLGRYSDAEPLLRRKLTATEDQNLMLKSVFMASRKEDLARLARLQKKYDVAEKSLRQIISDLESEYGATNSYQSSPLMELARLYEDQERYADSLKEVERVASLNAQPSAELLLFRAKLRWKLDERDKAIDDCRSAMERVEQTRGQGTGGEMDRSRLFAKYDDIYDTLVDWLIVTDQLEEAFAVTERFRARALIDQLELQGVDLLAGIDPKEAYQLRWNESVNRARIATIERMINKAGNDTAKVAELRQQLEQAQEAFMQAYREVRNASPAYRLAVSKDFQPVPLKDVKQWASDRQALILEYIIGIENSYLITIRPGDTDPTLHKLTIGGDHATRLGVSPGELTTDRLHAVLMNEKKIGVLDQLRNEKSEPPLDKLAALNDLLLPAEVRETLYSSDVQLVVVIPHGPLGLFPFEALVSEPGDAPRYLLDVAPPFVYAPSVTVLLGLDARKGTSSGSEATPVLTVGDPQYASASSADSRGTMAQLAPRSRYTVVGGKLPQLPHSGLESKWISDVFSREGMNSTRLTRKEATEDKVRANSANKKIIHLACHGMADQAYGNLFGALALTPGTSGQPEDDGFLTLAEIYQLDLKSCDLAVLSACETNYGPQQRGEGTWSLSRGFLVAGARRVVASNWLVDDEAASSLISYFCAGVARDHKTNKLDATATRLQAAKRWVREQEKWKNPYYWASFVLVGPN